MELTLKYGHTSEYGFIIFFNIEEGIFSKLYFTLDT